MKKINYMTINELYCICESMINKGKGNYKIFLATGGYYDSHAVNYYSMNDKDKELVLNTPI